jgi:hypothetical protein
LLSCSTLDYSENTMLQQVQEAVLETVRELVVGTNAYIAAWPGR